MDDQLQSDDEFRQLASTKVGADCTYAIVERYRGPLTKMHDAFQFCAGVPFRVGDNIFVAVQFIRKYDALLKASLVGTVTSIVLHVYIVDPVIEYPIRHIPDWIVAAADVIDAFPVDPQPLDFSDDYFNQPVSGGFGSLRWGDSTDASTTTIQP